LVWIRNEVIKSPQRESRDIPDIADVVFIPMYPHVAIFLYPILCPEDESENQIQHAFEHTSSDELARSLAVAGIVIGTAQVSLQLP
jgi:hypothetical protein